MINLDHEIEKGSFKVKNEIRTIKYDTELNIEAYNFKGIMQKFPNHFHDCYVIGFIDSGRRRLECKNKEYIVEPGDIVVFNPKDNHACEQIDNKTLDYRCINIKVEVMRKVAFDITGKEYTPYFNKTVLFHSELSSSLKELHSMIFSEEKDFKKEELFYFLIEQLIEEFTEPAPVFKLDNISSEIEMICEFLENNYTRNITLNELSDLVKLSKYYLLRSFTKQKGISPYSYLETIRINKAKLLLEGGTSIIETAMETGFVDQSHFSKFFKNFIGLTPRQYMKIFIEKDNEGESYDKK